MEAKKRCGSNFNEEPLSVEAFLENYNNFFHNFSGTRLTKPKRGNNLTEKEKRSKRFYYAEIAYRRKTGDHKKGDMRNYYFLKKFDKKLADKIKRKYRIYSDCKDTKRKNKWEELLKLGYEAYLLLRKHTDDETIQEALQERVDNNGSDDYKAFFA